MELRILGPLEIVEAGESLALGSAQQQAVLALLIVNSPGTVSLDRLLDGLWGEHPPASARHAVQVHVSAIRKLLRAAGGRAAVRTTTSGYALDIEPEWIDARRFERLVEQAQHLLATEPAEARARFDRALTLWRGPPLTEFDDVEPVAHEADRLGELRVLALEGLAESRLASGEHSEAIGTLTGLVAANPLRERPRQLLMVALYRSGRHAEALAAYRDACAALDEIGLRPGPELRQLEAAILRHDASLSRPSGPAAVGPALVEQAPVSPGAVTQGSARRKVVTLLFCDVAGSTALGGALDPEALHAVMDQCFRVLRTVIERHGGSVEKFAGTAMMAVFGVPRVREDDALRAVRAAAEIGEQLAAVAAEAGVTLSFRAAVNTGLVLTGEAEGLASGEAVSVAARLEQAAAPGEIWLGEETVRLVRDAVEILPLGPQALEGTAAPVRAFLLVSVDRLAPGRARDFDRSLVGRARELDLLRAAWERTVRESRCQLFTLLGVAGVGKSRLVAEMLASITDAATVLRGRCLHYGEGITFWPLIEALTPVAEPARHVLERLRSGGVATPEELFFDVRCLLESLARERPVILHVDDVQWAERMLLDLIDHIADLSRGEPILLLCTARPELLDDRRGWGGGKLNASTVLLESLGAADCERLLDQLGDSLPPAVRAHIIATSEGNPFFLEEMAAVASEQAVVAVPSTIQALLAARLELLATEERELLELGAIEGEVFHAGAVRFLAGESHAAPLGVRVAALVRKDLIRVHPSTLRGGGAFRFRHLLIRDAAYDGLPKATRARLHERFAGWLEGNARDLAELDEIAGWHLEQAVRYLRSLGRGVDLSLARRAAEHLHAAGRRARERSDPEAARGLLDRAHALAADEASLRAGIAVDLADALIDAGDLDRADRLLSSAERDPRAAALAGLIRLEWLRHARPRELTRTIESTLPGIVERLIEAGDERGLAKAHIVAAGVHWLEGRAEAAAAESLAAAHNAANAGDEGLRSVALAGYISTLAHGPEAVASVAEKLDAIEQENPGPFVTARTLLARGQLERLAGHFPEARRLTERAKANYLSLGMRLRAGVTHMYLADIERMDGNPAAALTVLLEGDELLAEVGERSDRATIQALLAQVYELLGDGQSTRAALALFDELGATGDVLNYAFTHAVRGRLALADGDAEAAERWARSGVELASGTDFVDEQGDLRLELARVLAALGREPEAIAEASRALELYEVKGDRPGAAAARGLLHDLGAGG